MDRLAEEIAKLFWVTYDPIVRAFGAIEGDEMTWEALPKETRNALITTFKNLLTLDLLRPGSQTLRQS